MHANSKHILMLIYGQLGPSHWRSQDFFRGEHFFKKYSIFFNFVKMSKKFSKKFVEKIAKNGFLSIFFEKFNKPAFNFCAFGRKTRFIGNFEKIFENISKNLLRKLLKIHYLSIFFKKFTQPCVNFSRVWKKNVNCWV